VGEGTSDPFAIVRVKGTECVVQRSEGAAKVPRTFPPQESRSLVRDNTLHPEWGHTAVLEVASLEAAGTISIEVRDDDVLGSDFMGMVDLDIGSMELLSQEEGEECGGGSCSGSGRGVVKGWHGLHGKSCRGSDNEWGEVYVSVRCWEFHLDEQGVREFWAERRRARRELEDYATLGVTLLAEL
jgi:hypothetical protein